MEHDLDDELRFHIEQETEKNVRLGMTRDDAERKARLGSDAVARLAARVDPTVALRAD